MPSNAATAAHRRLRFAGLAILLAGWVCAVGVFVAASGNEDADAGAAGQRVLNGQVYVVPLDASKRQQQEVERMGGKATVRMAEFEDWLGSLWHGKRLAFTLALLSTAIGGACVYLAGLAAEDLEGR